jgi:AcrR family transcriptional regulator
MSNQKADLLNAILNYLARHGVADMSLRPMAGELGTSPRMLLFYFGSKEGLIQAVMDELHARLQASFVNEVQRRPGEPKLPPIKRFWEWAMTGDNSDHLRLLYEMQVIAAQNPAEFQRYLERNSADWQALALEQLSDTVRSPVLATLCVAVFDGLFLEFMSTGQRDRLSDALDLFVALANGRSHAPADQEVKVQKP